MQLQKKSPAILKGYGLPEYDEIKPKDIQKYIPILLEELNNTLSKLEKEIDNDGTISWKNVLVPLHTIEERLRWSWGTVCHLNAVCNSNELREVFALQQPEIIRFSRFQVSGSVAARTPLKICLENRSNFSRPL